MATRTVQEEIQSDLKCRGESSFFSALHPLSNLLLHSDIHAPIHPIHPQLSFILAMLMPGHASATRIPYPDYIAVFLSHFSLDFHIFHSISQIFNRSFLTFLSFFHSYFFFSPLLSFFSWLVSFFVIAFFVISFFVISFSFQVFLFVYFPS